MTKKRNPERRSSAPAPAPDGPDALHEAQRQQAGRRLHADHQRLKIAFADAYVEMEKLRDNNTRLNEIIQEQQRVMHELSEKLPKDKPEATP